MNILEQAIGWLAPPVCIGCELEGETLCLACREAEILPYGERCAFCSKISLESKTCPKCRRGGSPKHIFVSTDYLGLGKELLKAYKFGHQRSGAKQIAEIMAETSEHFIQDGDSYVVVPVPPATSRARQRGFDHTLFLARHIAACLKQPLCPAMGRLGQSRQVGARRSERQKQLSGAYFVRQPEQIRGKNILIVDDVITTGATLREVYKTLRGAGAKQVDALVFAKKL